MAATLQLVTKRLQNLEEDETQLFPVAFQIKIKTLYSTNQTDTFK